MCCLKRPFDDQSQPRIRIEIEAVLSLLSLESINVKFVRSPALFLENDLNPIPERASRVESWLNSGPPEVLNQHVKLEQRVAELMRLGLKGFNALHVASAEYAKADLFVTVDDRLLAALKRNSAQIGVRGLSVLQCAMEVPK